MMAGAVQPYIGGTVGGLRAPRPRRRQNLTPMIDVIFLLLVFFMLAARFGQENALPLQTATSGGAGSYSGPPRLIDIAAQGPLRLNGQEVAWEELPARLAPLVSASTDTIVLRPGQGTALQNLLRVMDGLRAAGFGSLVVVE